MFRSLKWLYPGMSIKRWIALICLGVMLAMLGMAALVFEFLMTDQVASSRARALCIAGFVLGGITLFTGFYRLMKSLGALVKDRGQEKDLVEIAYERRYLSRGPRIVALGGGTGMSQLLLGLKEHTREITAVVSVADDGGSSGRLRKELDMLPPGDVRKCLVALSDESPRMGQLLTYRFESSELNGHAFGNLFLTALTRITGDFGEAVREAGRILSIRGQVIPATLDRVTLVATHENGTKTTGQRLISETGQRIVSVALKPNPGPVAPDIRRALHAADLIVLGPGSLYTSVLPNLLIDGIPEAIRRSRALKVYICNVMTHEGETRGFTLRDHLEALRTHVGDGLFDYVLVNSGTFPAAAVRRLKDRGIIPVRYTPQEFNGREAPVARGPMDAALPEGRGPQPRDGDRQPGATGPDEAPDGEGDGLHALPFQVVQEDVVSRANELWHDPNKLARALMDLLQRERV